MALYMLTRADPHVRVESGRSGEYIMCCAGEVHLERCAKELLKFKRHLSPGSLRISKPRIGVRETVWETSEFWFHGCCLQALPISWDLILRPSNVIQGFRSLCSHPSRRYRRLRKMKKRGTRTARMTSAQLLRLQLPNHPIQPWSQRTQPAGSWKSLCLPFVCRIP